MLLGAVDAAELYHLSEDAADAPGVELGVVILLSKDCLWRPVPARNYVHRVLTRALPPLFPRCFQVFGNVKALIGTHARGRPLVEQRLLLGR